MQANFREIPEKFNKEMRFKNAQRGRSMARARTQIAKATELCPPLAAITRGGEGADRGVEKVLLQLN